MKKTIYTFVITFIVIVIVCLTIFSPQRPPKPIQVNTALGLLIENGSSIDAIEEYINLNPDHVNKYNLYGWLPIHIAVDENRPDVVRLLVTRGADIEARTLDQIPPGGQTPLHLAVYQNNKAIMQYLIKSGASLNAIDGKGRTVLD